MNTTILGFRHLRNGLLILFAFAGVPENIYGQYKSNSLLLTGSLEKNFYDFNERVVSPDYTYHKSNGSSFGLGFMLQLKDELFVQTGILKSQQWFDFNYNFITRDNNDPRLPINTRVKISNYTVPLKLGYFMVSHNHFSAGPSIGVNTTFNSTFSENTQYGDGATKNSNYFFTNYERVVAALYFDLTIQYEFTDHLGVTVSPYLANDLKALDTSTMKSGRMSTGITLGLKVN